jgi:ElaB/YqjD/DUF883 family membrane-anchored ribosome-binding protein
MSNDDSLTSALQNAGEKVTDTVGGLRDKGQEAVERVHDVWGALRDALEKSIKERPYTTLAMAGFVGFLYGAMRRR